MWLHQVEDLESHLVLHVFPFHHRLRLEQVVDEDLSKAFLEVVVCFQLRRRVLLDVDFGAAHRLARLARGLVSVPGVESEH